MHDTFQGYHEPGAPIPPEITALTGIDDAKVAGHKLDLDAVGSFVAPSVIVLAHNAGFDRLFVEQLHPWFATKAWGCTMSEPPWLEEGFEELKLSHLAAQSGFFYDKHRTLHDCLAALEILRGPSPSPAARVQPVRRPFTSDCIGGVLPNFVVDLLTQGWINIVNFRSLNGIIIQSTD